MQQCNVTSESSRFVIFVWPSAFRCVGSYINMSSCCLKSPCYRQCGCLCVAGTHETQLFFLHIILSAIVSAHFASCTPPVKVTDWRPVCRPVVHLAESQSVICGFLHITSEVLWNSLIHTKSLKSHLLGVKNKHQNMIWWRQLQTFKTTETISWTTNSWMNRNWSEWRDPSNLQVFSMCACVAVWTTWSIRAWIQGALTPAVFGALQWDSEDNRKCRHQATWNNTHTHDSCSITGITVVLLSSVGGLSETLWDVGQAHCMASLMLLFTLQLGFST